MAQNDSHRSHLRTFGIFGPLLDTNRNRWIELLNHCEDSLPAFTLVKTREDYYRKKLIALVDEDLYAPLELYRSLGRRSKWFASLVISTVTGLVTLAIEGISGYLQRKRNKAMANAMDALHRAQVENYDSLQ